MNLPVILQLKMAPEQDNQACLKVPYWQGNWSELTFFICFLFSEKRSKEQKKQKYYMGIAGFTPGIFLFTLFSTPAISHSRLNFFLFLLFFLFRSLYPRDLKYAECIPLKKGLTPLFTPKKW